MPSVSIIVPIFNGLRYFPYFLESLARALPGDAELIFVDDGSSEPVLDAIPDDFPVTSVVRLRNERNFGYSVAVNRGFDHATGDIVVQLNTDLVLDRSCITAMMDLIESSPRTGIVGSKQIFPTTGALRHIGVAFGLRDYRLVYVGMSASHPLCCKTRAVQVVSGATQAMTRKVLDEIGKLDERYYNTHENTDHCLKAQRRGYVNYACAESIAYHWVAQSGPARFARADEDNALFWSEWAGRSVRDLDRFVDEALDSVLERHPTLIGYPFQPLSLCMSYDEAILLERLERRWTGAASRVMHTRVYNNAAKKHWLPMELPHRAMLAPVPYVYLVDSIDDLSENRLWFEMRRTVIDTELVVDANACVITTEELLALYGAPVA